MIKSVTAHSLAKLYCLLSKPGLNKGKINFLPHLEVMANSLYLNVVSEEAVRREEILSTTRSASEELHLLSSAIYLKDRSCLFFLSNTNAEAKQNLFHVDQLFQTSMS